MAVSHLNALTANSWRLTANVARGTGKKAAAEESAVAAETPVAGLSTMTFCPPCTSCRRVRKDTHNIVSVLQNSGDGKAVERIIRDECPHYWRVALSKYVACTHNTVSDAQRAVDGNSDTGLAGEAFLADCVPVEGHHPGCAAILNQTMQVR